MLSAAGNLRALLTGLILTIVAQASLRGVLSEPRSALAQLWTVEAGAGRDLLAFFHFDIFAGVLIGVAGLAGALYLARRNHHQRKERIDRGLLKIRARLDGSPLQSRQPRQEHQKTADHQPRNRAIFPLAHGRKGPHNTARAAIHRGNITADRH